MGAEYETTSSALADATYELAKNPDVLQKLHDEIDQLPLFSDDNDENETQKYPDYDIVAQMLIWNYSFRKQATEDTVLNGIKINKGSLVHADIYSVHFDQELWGPDDPYIFSPERHLTKHHAMAYLPFGAGPQHCIDMRFALIEMKLLMI